MSIKERVDAKVAAIQEAEILAKKEEEKKKFIEEAERLAIYKKLEDRRETEKPTVLEALDAKFKSLRKSGIINLMEDFTGHKFPRIIPPTQEEVQEAIRNLGLKSAADILGGNAYSRRGWHLGVIIPHLNALDGQWEPKDLLLTMYENVYGVFAQTRNQIEETKLVTVNYNDSKTLTIAGEQTFFTGKIPRVRASRIELFEKAFAEAVVHPLVQKNESRHRSHPLAHRVPDIIIGAGV